MDNRIVNPPQEDYDSADFDDGQSNGRRKRSRDRDRDRSNRRHKHRHSKRSRRSRTRSSSSSERHNKVHLNPMFSGNISNLGPSATLVYENNQLELEVNRLKTELNLGAARTGALENELRRIASDRARLDVQIKDLNNEKRKLYADIADAKKATTLSERALTQVRTENSNIKKDRDQLAEQLCQANAQMEGIKEQSEFLTSRNEVLRRKCEELVEKNKAAREEVELANNAVSTKQREVENMEANVELKMIEYKRMENDLGTAREKERIWKMEKMEFEKRLRAKEIYLSQERKQSELQKKQDKEQILRLEEKLKNERPGWESQLGIESIFRALEVVKAEFGSQMTELKGQVAPLTEQCRNLNVLVEVPRTPIQRPPRVQSAPACPVSSQSDDGIYRWEANHIPTTNMFSSSLPSSIPMVKLNPLPPSNVDLTPGQGPSSMTSDPLYDTDIQNPILPSHEIKIELDEMTTIKTEPCSSSTSLVENEPASSFNKPELIDVDNDEDLLALNDKDLSYNLDDIDEDELLGT